MDRKERTLRALQGLPVDRPPMVFWHHFVGADMEKENFVVHMSVFIGRLAKTL